MFFFFAAEIHGWDVLTFPSHQGQQGLTSELGIANEFELSVSQIQ